MGNQAGIADLEGQPLNMDSTEAFCTTLKQRRNALWRIVKTNSLVMAYSTGFSCDESLLPVQPLVTPGQLVVTWDGRLDNHNELKVLVNKAARHAASDIGLVAEFYEQMGVTSVGRLIGDFASCVWDNRERALYLIRDAFGCRPLFYLLSGSRVLWSSSLERLIGLAGEARKLDPEYPAGYITFTEDPARTPYKEIFSVPPGCFIRFDASGSRTRSFWSANQERPELQDDDSACEEQFKGLLFDAVQCRLRSGKTFAELSGGLDSSSIVCVANKILGSASDSSLSTVSYLYDGSDTADERRFIKEVERETQLNTSYISDHRILTFDDQNALPRPNPLQCFNDTFSSIANLMHNDGSSLLLSGFGGDHVLMNECLLLSEINGINIRKRLAQFVRLFKAARQESTMRWYALLWLNTLFPRLPLSLQRICFPKHLILPPWLNRAYAQRAGCVDRALDFEREYKSFSSRRQCAAVNDAIALVSRNYYVDFEIDATYPFLHRPLVDFLLAVPISQKVRPREQRSLHRRALRGILPERVRVRRSKGGPDEAVHRALARPGSDISRLVEGNQLAAAGFVDLKALKAAVTRARFGLGVELPQLMRTLSLEHWMRSRPRSSANTKSENVAKEPIAMFTLEQAKSNHGKEVIFT